MSSVDHRATLLLILKQRLNSLVEAMPAAQAGDSRSVHQARVATRRLREALPVLRSSMDAQALRTVRQQVRQITRALGPVRELDVALQHLEEVGTSRAVSRRAVARVRQAITRERTARRRDLLASISPGKIEKLRQRLGQASAAPAPPRSGAAIDEAHAQVARRADRLARAIHRAGGLYVPERLHAVRIAAKKLRYALEIERELQRSRSTARITQLKRLQDLLGRLHDFEVLIGLTRAVQTDLAATDRPLTQDLDRLVGLLEAECRRDHAAYMGRRASILKLCDTLRDMHRMPAAVA
jgi:CHAD domain-containing protein